VTALSNEVNDGPVLFATLEMIDCEAGKFPTAKSAACQNC
jgi:hypothetical protein